VLEASAKTESGVHVREKCNVISARTSKELQSFVFLFFLTSKVSSIIVALIISIQ
jgi:hypothetical protein